MNSKFFSSYLFYILIGTAIIVSFLTLFSQSIRLDEAQSIWQSTKSPATLLKLLSEDVHVPLYGLLLHYWMQIFGNTITAARSLSFIFYLATLPVLYLVIKETANQKLALISVTLFALSPFIVWYSSEARMYTLFTLVTCFNHLYFLRFYRSKAKSGKVGLFISTIIGLYTHYFFLFLLVPQLIFILFKTTIKTLPNNKKVFSPFHEKLFLTTYLGIVGGAALFFLPWIWYVLTNGSVANTQPMIMPPTSYNIFQVFVNFLFGFQTDALQSGIVSLWPIIVLVIFFIFTTKKKQSTQDIHYFTLVTFLPITLVFLVSFVRPIFLSRYLILITPTLFFIIAWLLSNYSKKISAITTTVVLLIMFSFMVFQNISTATPAKEDYQGVATYLQKNAKSQDIIAVSAPFTIYPLEYTYTGNARMATIPLWNRYIEGAIPPFSQEKFIEQINKYKTNYASIYLVLSYDQGYEDKIRQYMNQNFELIQSKSFSEDLEIRRYRLRYLAENKENNEAN